jgi:hypothetical protein
MQDSTENWSPGIPSRFLASLYAAEFDRPGLVLVAPASVPGCQTDVISAAGRLPPDEMRKEGVPEELLDFSNIFRTEAEFISVNAGFGSTIECTAKDFRSGEDYGARSGGWSIMYFNGQAA